MNVGEFRAMLHDMDDDCEVHVAGQSLELDPDGDWRHDAHDVAHALPLKVVGDPLGAVHDRITEQETRLDELDQGTDERAGSLEARMSALEQTVTSLSAHDARVMAFLEGLQTVMASGSD